MNNRTFKRVMGALTVAAIIIVLVFFSVKKARSEDSVPGFNRELAAALTTGRCLVSDQFSTDVRKEALAPAFASGAMRENWRIHILSMVPKKLRKSLEFVYSEPTLMRESPLLNIRIHKEDFFWVIALDAEGNIACEVSYNSDAAADIFSMMQELLPVDGNCTSE